MTAEVDGYHEVPLCKVVDLVIPIRAVAGPAVHQHHGGRFTRAGAMRCIRDLNAVAATCHPLSAQPPRDHRQLETSPSGGRHDLDQHVRANRKLSVERAFLGGDQHQRDPNRSREDPHCESGRHAIVAVDERDRDQR